MEVVEEMGGTTVEDTRDFFTKLVQPGLEPYVVALELIEEEEKKNQAESEQDKNPEAKPGMQPPVRITGKYLLHDDKVVGQLNDRETRGCNWIVGKVQSGSLVLRYPVDQDIKVDVIVTGGTSKTGGSLSLYYYGVFRVPMLFLLSWKSILSVPLN